jgi:hypothetical protein
MRIFLMVEPAIKKRGGDPDIKPGRAKDRRAKEKFAEDKPAEEHRKDKLDDKLEEALEESMAGSDPVSITQPAPSKFDSVGSGSKDNRPQKEKAKRR